MIPAPPGLDGDNRPRRTLPPGTPVTNTFGAYPYVRPDRPYSQQELEDIIMECQFNKRFDKWEPIKHIPNGNVSDIKLLD